MTCPVSGKRRYPSAVVANVMLTRITRKDPRIQLRVYLDLSLFCLPHLRPPELLSLADLPASRSGHRPRLGASVGRRIRWRQFAQHRDCFVQLC